jgi:co-chaperonin GroES (HSP10)
MTDLIPMEYRVVIELDPINDRSPSGLVILTDEIADRMRMEAVEGKVIAASPLAFKFEEGAPKAEIGDRVFFNRYSGSLIERGEKWVRIVTDRDIVAVVRA